MADFVRFEHYSEDLARGIHNLADDALKVYLSNTAPDVAAMAVKADLAEIAAGNGYPAGGLDAQNALARAGAQTTITGEDAVFTAAGGAIAAARYAVLYNDTPAAPADPLIGYWDYGESIAPKDGETFTVDVGAALLTVG